MLAFEHISWLLLYAEKNGRDSVVVGATELLGNGHLT